MSLDLSLGGIEVGVMISTLLYGITNVQIYIYYSQDAPRDPWYIRVLVPLIWLIDTLHTIFTIKYLYNLTVTNFGNIASIGSPSFAINTSAFFDGLSGAFVQGFFAHRIYALSRKWTITIIVWMGSACVISIDTSIMILAQTTQYTIDQFQSKYRPVIIAGFAVQLCVDLINTTSLCIFLRIERTGFRHTDGMLNKLFIWTIQTGIVTSLAAILMLVFCVALPSTTLWVCISIFYSKLYSNSLMASLNGRKSLREALDHSDTTIGTSRVSALQFSGTQHTTQGGNVELLPRLPESKSPFGSYHHAVIADATSGSEDAAIFNA